MLQPHKSSMIKVHSDRHAYSLAHGISTVSEVVPLSNSPASSLQ
jgi:hypothetical protein